MLNARDEQDARQAEEAEAPAEETPPAGTAQTTTTTTTQVAAAASKLKLAADPTGQLAFVQKSLSTKAGAAEIDFTNDSPVGHDVCLESESGDELGCSDVITGASTTLEAEVDPGTYAFYCSVTGHRDAGMEGTLSVK